MAKISVIVPAYNAGKTLASCLGNLVYQTFEDIELILVNDCSTDNTLQIMMDCEAQFPEKVIVVNSDKNRGAGGARNVGLCYASGEYIGFVDSDDLVEDTMYEKLYTKAVEGNYDIVDCGYYDERDKEAILLTADEMTGDLNGEKRSQLIAGGGYLWSKLFKADFLREIEISFRENCILEDHETLMMAFATAKRIGNVKEVLYCYKKGPDSISQCADATKFFTNATAAMEAIYNTMSVLPEYPQIQEAVEYSIINLCVLCMKVCRNFGTNEPESLRKYRLQTIANYSKNLVKLPYGENRFIQDKIDRNDLTMLRDLEGEE